MRLWRRSEIEAIMRRLGMADRVPEVRQLLPEEIDIERDGKLLLEFGLSLDRIVDRLGGSAW